MKRPLGYFAMVALVAAVSVVPSETAAQYPAPQRVRAASKIAADLLNQGIDRSATIRALVDRLDQSDVIVRIDTRTGLPNPARTTLADAGAVDGRRTVDIAIDLRVGPTRWMELLGHELQHATEIACASDVRDNAALRVRLTAIGWQVGNRNAFETEAAQRTEVQVRHDLFRGAR